MAFRTAFYAALCGTLALATAVVAKPAPIEFKRLAHGFVAETFNADGMDTGFAAPNPWGQYTAYLMATNERGQRSWRIEHYLPFPQGGIAQGSTMYLLEGDERALLIDTANPAVSTPGVNDLKTVVRQLLGHENDGAVRAKPLDFVVANTHSHPDHIGENGQMSDRTVYYMDLDWPADAPANYVPIREGGGPTMHGSGTAAGRIEFGHRTLTAIAMPPHTPGSTGYLDADNGMMFTGDAIGTGYVWLQWAPLAEYRKTLAHLIEVTAKYPGLTVLGAHFYQYDTGTRAPQARGRVADIRYIHDQKDLVDGILAGKIEGIPYAAGGAGALIATNGTAQIVYSAKSL